MSFGMHISLLRAYHHNQLVPIAKQSFHTHAPKAAPERTSESHAIGQDLFEWGNIEQTDVVLSPPATKTSSYLSVDYYEEVIEFHGVT
jgi:hypothetical protein